MTTCLAHPDRAATAACSACGAELCAACAVHARGADWCEPCFASLAAAAAPSEPPPAPPPPPAWTPPGARLKSPVLAAFLSLIPGFGTIYCFGGPAKRGLVQFALWALGIWIYDHAHGLLAALTFLATIGFYFWQIVDAVGTARLFNSLGRIPSEDEAASMGRGPYLVGTTNPHGLGMALLVIGCALLAAEILGAILGSVQWIWPFALIGLGAWIVWRARRKRYEAPMAGDPPGQPA